MRIPVVWGFQFLNIYCLSFCYSHSCGCIIVSHFDSNLHFPNDEWCWSSSHVHIGHLYIFFGEISIQILCSFLNWVVFLLFNFKSSLYILNTNPLSDTWFSNIISHSVGCLFTFLMVFFEAQFFNSDKVQLICFFFVLSVSHLRNHCLIHCCED